MLQLATIFLMLWATPGKAQTALTAAIQGTVRDAGGGAMVGAAVELLQDGTAVSKQTTDSSGGFRFVRIAPGGGYALKVSAEGMQSWTRAGIEALSGDSASFAIVLEVGQRSETVEVAAQSPIIALESTELATSVVRKALDQLPTNGRVATRFALLDARVRNSNALSGDGSNQYRLAINANTFRDSQHRLDGNTNYDTMFNNIPLQRVPLVAVQEFRVLTNQFSAEHGSTSAGLTITTTKTGSEEFRGEGFFLGRPSGIQARPPLANLRIPNQLLQAGGAVGGPVVGGKTYFFTGYERTAQDRGSFISSGERGFYLGEYRDQLAVAKLDHRWSDTHWLSVRVNGHRDRNTNANDRVGGLLQPRISA